MLSSLSCTSDTHTDVCFLTLVGPTMVILLSWLFGAFSPHWDVIVTWSIGSHRKPSSDQLSHQSSPARTPPHERLWDMETMFLRFRCSERSQFSGLAGFKCYDVSVGIAMRRLWQMRNEIHKLLLTRFSLFQPFKGEFLMFYRARNQYSQRKMHE